MNIGKRARALARNAFAAVMAASLALTMAPSAGIAFAAENVAGGGLSEPLDAQAPSQDEAAEAAQSTEIGAIEEPSNDVILSEEDEALEAEEAPTQDGETADIPALDVINQDVPLETVVAQAESTRTFFLAQTLESTRTVPIVSAKLPLDTAAADRADQISAPTDQPASDTAIEGSSAGDGSGDGSTEEGGDDSDDPDLAGDYQDESVAAERGQQPAAHTELAPDSVVVGSFTQNGITYALEPGGETVAVVAADFNKLPQEFLDVEAIVIPEAATPDGWDYYSVNRIADGAFQGLNAGCRTSLAPAESTSDSADEARSAITILAIPAPLTSIDDDAIEGFDTLENFVVDEDNPTYSSYDGVLYDADQTNLLLIPGGRKEGVRVPRTTQSISEQAFSHCATAPTLYVDPDSPVLTLGDDFDTQIIAAETLDDLIIDDSERQDLAELIALVNTDARDYESNSAVTVDQGESLKKAVTNTYTVTLYGTPNSKRWSYISQVTSLGNAGKDLYDSNGSYNGPYPITLNSSGYVTLGYGNGKTTHGGWCSGLYNMLDFWYFNGMDRHGAITRDGIRQSYDVYTTAARTTLVSKGYTQVDSINRTYFLPLDYIEIGLNGTSESGSGTWSKVSGSGTVASEVLVSTFQDTGNVSWKDFTLPKEVKPNIASGQSPKIFVGWNTSSNATVETESGWWYRCDGKYEDSWTKEAWGANSSTETTAYVSALPYNQLYAIFSDGYQITLDPSTPGESAKTFLALDENLSLEQRVQVPDRPGYVFTGYHERIYEGDSRYSSFSGTIYSDEKGNYKRNYWYRQDGSLISSGTGDDYVFSAAHNSYPLTADVTLYADWVRDVTLDAQNGDVSFDKIHAIWQEDLPTQAIASGDCADDVAVGLAHTFKDLPAPPEKAGYEFNGYWSHRYDESDPDNDLYYTVEDGKLVPVEGKRWDIDDQDRLYAHWKYRIVLNSNTYDSDGDLVLRNGSTFYCTVNYAGSDPTNGQSSLTDEFSYSVPSKNDGEPTVCLPHSSFTAIEGAPLTLPSVKNRPGYDPTQQWGTTQLYYGKADNTLELTDGVTGEDPAVGTPASYDEGITLYANWASPKSYNVKLVFSYDYPADSPQYSYAARTQESGGVALSDITLGVAAGTVKSTYDAKIDLTGLGFALDGARATAGSDELVFKGFYTDRHAKFSSKDETHALFDQADRETWYVRDDGTAARALREVGDGTTVTLYALWGYPEVDIDFNMQDAALTGETLTGAVQQRTKADGTLEGGRFFQNLTTNDAMPDVTELLSKYATAPSRAGFTFNGFWTTEYDEADATKQYYVSDGTCLYNDAGGNTWDKTSGITLYAHWKYTVRLDMNVVNTDGQLVLTDDESDYRANLSSTVGLSTTREFRIPLPVQDSSSTSATLTAYEFENIDGAPITLPRVTGRPGYDDATVWGTSSGSKGNAGDTAREGTEGFFSEGTTQPFRATLKNVSAVVDGAEVADARALVLYADWWKVEDGEEVTLALTYDVSFVTDYADFQVVSKVVGGKNVNAQTLQVKYDEPVPVDQLIAYEGNYVDATTDAGVSRNLVLRGFYRDECVLNSEGAANKAYVTVASDAFANGDVKFRELSASAGTSIRLYALWGYNVTTITFDLQGGRIGSSTDNPKVTGVESHSALKELNELAGAPAAAPTRDGYRFAGWWTTPYNENEPKEESFSGGLLVTPKRYYGDGSDVGSGATAAQKADHPTWEEYGDTTLYAHWKYDISFSENLQPDTDIADVSLKAVPASNAASIVSETMLLAAGDANAPETDRYGNVYTAGTKSTRVGSVSTDTLTIVAIAGAPVKLPSAQNRRAYDGVNAYERIGYNSTWRWAWDANPVVSTPVLDVTANTTDRFTAEADSWSGGIPCKLGGNTTQSRNLLLHAQWEGCEMEYAVQVNYAYAMGADAATSMAYNTPVVENADGSRASHADSIMLYVAFDHDDYYYDAAKTDLATDESTPLDAGDASALRARADSPGALSHENLVFSGISTMKQNLADSPDNASYGDTNASTGAVRYWNADGSLHDKKNAANDGYRFRAVRGAEWDVLNATNHPVQMYAAWAEPTSTITFDLIFPEDGADNLIEDDLVTSNTAGQTASMKAQKGGDVVRARDGAQAYQIADLSARIRDLEQNGQYKFGGFWTAPDGFDAWDETSSSASSDPSATPTCYFLMDGNGDLVRADAGTDIAGSVGSWLTLNNDSGAQNASIKWLEDDDEVTLYAHWKYKIQFSVDSDDVTPNSSVKDGLLFGADTDEALESATSDFVQLKDIGGFGSQVDSRGFITYGMPLTLPVDADSQNDVITRVRDFSARGVPQGYGTGKGRTGYEFTGWTTEGASEDDYDTIDMVTAAGAGVLTQSSDARIQPATGSNGMVSLYAQWTPLKYNVTYQYYPEDRYGDFITTDSINVAKNAGTAVSVQLPYDATFADTENATIVPPAMYGFEYRGYFAKKPDREGDLNSDDGTSRAGTRYYNETLNAPGTPDDGRSVATDAPVYSAIGRGQTTLSLTIYAYYQRVGTNVTFMLRDDDGNSTARANDGTMQLIDSDKSAKPTPQVWYYGTKLSSTPGNGELVAANPGSVTWSQLMPDSVGFARHGYNFDGWYILKDKPDDYDSMTDAQKAAWHANRENRIYLFRADTTDANAITEIEGIYTADNANVKDGKWWTCDYDRDPNVSTFRSVDGLFDAEVDRLVVYASWTPKSYNVSFKTNFKNDSQNVPDLDYVFYYEQEIEPYDPSELGKPMTFVGWNESAERQEASRWLFDKATYIDNPNQLDRYYTVLKTTGVFMPSGDYRSFTYEAVWDNPDPRTIYLFAGKQGSLSGGKGLDGNGTSSEPAYKAMSYQYTSRIRVSEASLNQEGIYLSVNNGYTFKGWVEVRPQDITGNTGTTSYSGLDLLDKTDDRLKAVSDNVKSASSFYNGYANKTLFPSGWTVGELKSGNRYTNPHDNQKLEFRDIYLVAVYEMITGYGIELEVDASDPDLDELVWLKPELGEGGENFGDPKSTSPIVYRYDFTPDSESFALPDVVSAAYEFDGWVYTDNATKTETPIESANLPWFEKGQDGAPDMVNVAAYLQWSRGDTHLTRLKAKLTPKKYRVVFETGEGDEGSEDIVLSNLGLKDTFTLPTPATRSGGVFFNSWGVREKDGSSIGMFLAGKEMSVSTLVNAILGNGSIPDDSGEGASECDMYDVEIVEGNTIMFDALWRKSIYASVPIDVRVSVDPDNHTVLSGLTTMTAYNDNDKVEERREMVRVVSLRYDRLQAEVDGEQGYVFGDDLAGKVYLAVYADLATVGDTTHLFAPENVNDDGTLKSGIANVETQAEPLLIDVTKDGAVYANTFPSASREGETDGPVWNGLYDNAHMHDATDPDHGLHSHGFRSFNASKPLPIRYSLVFRGIDGQRITDLAPMLGQINRDSTDAKDALPIAKVYYTISLAPAETA